MANMKKDFSVEDMIALVEELGADSWYYSEARENLMTTLDPVIRDANPDNYEEIIADKKHHAYLCVSGVVGLYSKYCSIPMVYTRLTELDCDLSGYTYDGFYQLVVGAFIYGLLEEYNKEILEKETDLTFTDWLQKNG